MVIMEERTGAMATGPGATTTATEAMVVSATTERGTLMLRLVTTVTMERGGAMATGDTGPEATTTARGRPRLRLVTMVIMEERTGAMATGPGATTTARGRLATMVTMERTGAMATGAMAMATVSTTD